MKQLPIEQVRKLWNLFRAQAEKGSPIFHQAHAEELLALADEQMPNGPTMARIIAWLIDSSDAAHDESSPKEK